MTRSGQRHAKWDLCTYQQSPITPILPGVIQQAFQFHSCHHNVVIWIIETGTHQNSVLLQTACSFPPNADFLIYFISFLHGQEGRHRCDDTDITMHAASPWCVQWAWLRARCSHKRTAVRPRRWRNSSEVDWAESHRVLRGFLGSHCHKWSHVSQRVQERRKEHLVERGEVNEVSWAGSMCRWTTPDLGPSYLLIFSTDIIKQGINVEAQLVTTWRIKHLLLQHNFCSESIIK